ncbi:MAG: ATP-dependent sacrificial sulfur transferase LarE [Methermicoccaceae archaeon]
MSTEEGLMRYLREHSPLVILFSGGVDSTVLCALAERAGAESFALTVDNCMLSSGEVERAGAGASELGVEHEVLKLDMLSSPAAQNTPERCYHCKRAMILAARQLRPSWQVAEGTNASELTDERAGMRAVHELGVLSPYLELGVGKEEIRELAERMGLNCAHQPSNACLATRIPYGEKITKDKLERVGRAEHALKEMGFLQVRVRAHGTLARLELGKSEMERAVEERAEVVRRLKASGFSQVCLDFEGYGEK